MLMKYIQNAAAIALTRNHKTEPTGLQLVIE